VEKQMAEERIEKVRKLREMKKFGKKVQIEVQQKREKEKREMLEQVSVPENCTFSFYRLVIFQPSILCVFVRMT
jgi:lysozyme family protein